MPAPRRTRPLPATPQGPLLDEVGMAAEPTVAVERFAAPARSAGDWQQFVVLYRALRTPGLRWPADIELVKTWYLPHL